MWKVLFRSVQPRVWGGRKLLSPRGGLVGPMQACGWSWAHAAKVLSLAQMPSTETAVLVPSHLALCGLPFLWFQNGTPAPCPRSRFPPRFPVTSPCSKEADLSFPVFKIGIETMPA